MANNIKEVYGLAKDIDRVITNFKKDGPSRKSLAYLAKKREILGTLEKKMMDEDAEFRKIEVPNDDYIKTLLAAQRLCKEFCKIMEEGMQIITNFHNKNPGVPLDAITLEQCKENRGEEEEDATNQASFFSDDDDLQCNEELDSCGFHLRKWCANNKDLLVNLPENECETKFNEGEENKTVKILGLHWETISDQFSFHVNKAMVPTSEPCTKRIVLARLASVFDPLGILSPSLLEAKLFVQELWSLKLDWDEPLGEVLVDRWNQFDGELHYLNEISIPRQIFIDFSQRVEIHGFCDASKTAFGAVVYARSIYLDKVVVNLICSKSRVVSLKKKSAELSMPRLELNAAVLLSELANTVLKTLKKPIDYVQFYTDSTTVLHWINKDESILIPYVSRRVKIIKSKTVVSNWRYVSSKNNPADIVSRGIKPKIFIRNEIWFKGPTFLNKLELSFDSFGHEHLINNDDNDVGKIKTCLVTRERVGGLEINHRNKFDFLVNVLALVIKFIYTKCNRKLEGRTWREYAIQLIISDIQDEFEEDKIKLRKGEGVNTNSKLKTLAPFIDSYGLIRVGGRISKASQLPLDARHPIVLSNLHPYTRLLIQQLHETHLHAGPQALLYILRQTYWPIRGRLLTKKVVNNCYRCFRCKPRSLDQIMGNLPSDRLSAQRPFLVCGVDFIGPMKIHHKIRGRRPDKAYVCAFVCFATKAVHIEVVSDLSTNAFMAAFKRMIGRRGCPVRVYSDNGSNFIGAAREIEENISSERFKNELIKKNIEWKFIPARSPHMGGIWEAAVKSIKNLYEKNIQLYTLTFEQLQTVMVEIEAVLNSRPLTPLSEDPNDLQVLCPSHFLIGEPLTSLPPSINESNPNLRDNWMGLSVLKTEFWKRWSIVYLSELQKRLKWNESRENIRIGTLVLLKDNNAPVLCWRRARVIECIKGDDNNVRVVELQTSTGTTKRSVHLVAPLPEELQPREIVEVSENSKEESKTLKTSLAVRVKKDKCKFNYYNWKTLLFVILLFVPLAVAKIEFDKINDKSILFFEDLGESRVVKSKYKLVAYFDLESYWSTKTGISEAVSHLRKACAESDVRIRNHTSCETITLQMSRKWDHTEKLHRFIFHTQRSKRAVLKFVGGILHDVIGVLDEDTANEYNRKIEENRSNQKLVVNMIKELATLHNSTVNLIEENNALILNELQDIRRNLNNVNTLTNIYLFENSITKTLLAIEEFKAFQLAIWEAIRDVHSGIFNPNIIDPIQLQLVLEKIRIHLPSTLSFPEASTFDLFKLLKVKCSTTVNNIIFEIQIPLTGTEVFSLYQVHQFPVIYENIMIQMESKLKYLLVNEKQDRFLEVVNSVDSNACVKTDSKWLCSHISEVHHVKDTKSCEMGLFLRHGFESIENCPISIVKSQEFLRKLTTGNHWILVEPSPRTFEISCGTLRSSKVIDGRGILHVQPGCQVKTATSTVVAWAEESNNVTFVTNDIDWNLILKTNREGDIVKTAIEEIKLPKLAHLPRAPPLTEYNLPSHDIHQFAVGYTSLILILICLGGFLYLALKFKPQIADLSQRFAAFTTTRSISVPRLENDLEDL